MKFDEDEGAPKRPSNAFCYFMQAQKNTMAGTYNVVRVLCIAGRSDNVEINRQ